MRSLQPETPVPLVEACVTSVAEARAAERSGAARLELCVSLEVGGVTPGPELVEAVRASCTLPVCVLVRNGPELPPTTGDLCRLISDVGDYAAMGVDGIVAGALDPRGNIDSGFIAEVVSAAGSVPVVFHRAFDESRDLCEGIEQLAEIGVARVLTSGGAPTAWAGREALRLLVGLASDRITVLAGGRIRAEHVCDLVRETGVREIHARASAISGIAASLGLPGEA